MDRSPLSALERALLNELADDDYSLPEIVEFCRDLSQETEELVVIKRAQEMIKHFLAKGWISVYRYFPPYDPGGSEELSRSEALRILDDATAWRLPVQHAHARVGLTPVGESVWQTF